MGYRFNNIQDDAVLISRGTGEIMGEFDAGSDISSFSQKEREAIQRKKSKNIRIRNNIDRMGGYTVHYRDGYKLLGKVGLDTAGALLILSQNILLNHSQEGFILIGTQGGGYVKAFKKKTHIVKALGFENKNKVYKIINEALASDFLRYTNEGFRLNEELFFKGSATKRPFIVSFNCSIRNLFTTNRVPIKTIGYLFRISEFLPRTVNAEDYTLIANPDEPVRDNQHFLTIEVLARRLAISPRTLIRLSDIKVTFMGFEKYGELPLMVRFGGMKSTAGANGLILNPLLFTNKFDEAIEKGLIKFRQTYPDLQAS
jgi:hypothetical protein